MAANRDEANTFRILLVTDVHLGFAERDPIRSHDSLVTFEEILEKAQEHNVDFVLMGGDLFHENKPPCHIIHQCLTLLRKYCMGKRPIQFKFLSNQSVNFKHCKFPVVNYNDPNLHISIPVFSIHGNHDDPTGPHSVCSLDILHSSGLLNYFGKTTSLKEIQLSPLLLQKGSTKLALYGLGSLRDEILQQMFLKGNVTMHHPSENKDDWFNLLVLHQNRAKHRETNFIPESILPEFLNLVFWGHEHECRLRPERNPRGFCVTQPGSSITTALKKGETKTKYIGLLEVEGITFEIKPVKLETVRQFYMEDIVLSKTSLDPKDINAIENAEEFCSKKVEQLIAKAAKEHTGNKKQPKEPLIRLRIDYTGFKTFNIYRFGRNFMNRVANPDRIILFTQEKTGGCSKKDAEGESLDTARVEDMVRDYFSRAEPAYQLQVLTERGLGEAVKDFVDKEQNTAISKLVENQLKESQDHLKLRNIKEDDIYAEVCLFKQNQKKKQLEEKEVPEVMKQSQVMQSQQEENMFSDDVRLDFDGDKSQESHLIQEMFSASSHELQSGRDNSQGPKQDYITIVEDRFDGKDLFNNIQPVGQNISTTASTCSSNRLKRGHILDSNTDEEFSPPQKKWK